VAASSPQLALCATALDWRSHW